MRSRRNVLASGSVVIATSLAGCVFGGSGESETTSEEEGEDSEEESQPTLAAPIADITAFLEWLNTDQQQARKRYIDTIQTAAETATILADSDPRSISTSLIESAATDIRAIVEPTVKLDTYYAEHIPFNELADRVESDFIGYIEQEEYDQLDRELTQLAQRLNSYISSGVVAQRYPRKIIYGEPYGLFSTQLRDGKIFEIQYQTDAITDSVWAAPSRLNFIHYPFGSQGSVENTDGVPTDYAETPSPTPDRDTNLHKNTSQLEVSTDRIGELYINILLLSESERSDEVPERYRFERDDEKRATLTGNLPEVNINEANGMGVYIQQYSSSEAASAALTTLSDNGTQSDLGPATINNIEYERYYYTEGDETVYADLRQDSEYVAAVDVSNISWEQRNRISFDDEEYSSDRVPLTENTFLNPSRIE